VFADILSLAARPQAPPRAGMEELWIANADHEGGEERPSAAQSSQFQRPPR
jgi:hypothetical protein